MIDEEHWITYPHPQLVEEMILNTNYNMCHIPGWRRYRIEYGFECGCPEGTVYLPPHADPDELETFLIALCKKNAK